MLKRTFFIFCILLMIPAVLVPEDSVRDIKKKLAHFGGLPFKSDVPVKYFDRKFLKSYIEKIFEEDYPDDLAAKESLFLQVMGFSDDPIDLKSIRKQILISNIGGLYNEKTKELFALEEYREIDMINSLVIVHELRHAIQDQHFDISALLGKMSDYDDRKLAVLSALEGDATIVMIQYSGFDPEILADQMSPDSVLSMAQAGNTALLNQAPDIVKYQLLMPYINGLKFVSHILKKKKIGFMNRILHSPPESSEQILHPEKYLKKELPVAVSVSFRPQGYELYHDGVIGEYYINILMKSEYNYRDVAAGWGGDRFEVFKNGDKYFLIWESEWDSEKIRARFGVDFRRFLEKKFQLNFEKGVNNHRAFFGAVSKFGFFFLYQTDNKIYYVRSNDREQMNQFIQGGLYD